MRTVSIHTLGCKLNFAESGTVGEQFLAHDYQVVPFGSPSDVTVINTCTVTEEADRKCRQAVRKAIRLNPSSFVLVTGCYAQLEPDTIAAIPGVDAVLGADEKFQLFSIVESFQKTEQTQVSVSCIDDVDDFGPAYAAGERTRAFLKVQDGCDYVCSFCTIPFARGKSRSANTDDIIRQAREIADAGYLEIVISGVNIGLFGEDTGESLLGLLQALDAIDGLNRIRISSIEPNLLTDEIIDFVSASERFMPHFHIPLQSGDDQVLGRMRRRYRSDRYADRVRKIKSVMPHAAIGVDVIVGFPGETEEQFENTQAFLNNLPVSYLHVFTYSDRPLASISSEPGAPRVPKNEKTRRNNLLRLLSEKKRNAFYREHLGTTRPVLWEDAHRGALQLGFTDNYIRVERPHESIESDTLGTAYLDAISASGNVLVGEREFIPLV